MELEQSNFALRWRDLLGRIESSRNALQARLEELEQNVEPESQELEEAKVSNFQLEMESKADELRGIEILIQEKGKRLVEVEKLVDQKERDCEKCNEEIELKMRQLNEIRGCIATHQSLEECDQQMKLKSNRIESMEKTVTRLQGVLHKYCEDIDVKRRQLNSICENVDLKQQQVEAVRKSIQVCDQEMKSKSDKLESVEKQVTRIQGVVNKHNEEITLRETELNSIRGCVEEESKVFDMKQEQIKAAHQSLEECEQKMRLKSDRIESMEKNVTRLQGVLNKYYEDIDAKRRHLNSICENVDVKWRELNSICENVDVKWRELNSICENVDLKKQQVEAVQESIQESCQQMKLESGKLYSVEKQVTRLQGVVDKRNEEIELKMRQLNEIRGFIEEDKKKFDLKKQQVKAVEESLEECGEVMKLKIEKVESMEKEVARLQGVLNKYCEDIDVKQCHLNSICEDIDVKRRDLSLTHEQIAAARKSLKECNEEIKSNWDQLSLLQKSVVECSNAFESRENMIREMALKMKDFGLLKESMEEWSCKLGAKERELEECVNNLEFREKQAESILKEFNVIDQRVSECLDEVQSKEQNSYSLGKLIQEHNSNLDSQENSLQEHSRGLAIRENKLEEQARELELKQKKTASTINATEEPIQNLKSERKTFVRSEVDTDQQFVYTPTIIGTDRNAATTSSPGPQVNANTDTGNLQSPPNEVLSENHSVQNKMSVDLQMSAEPERLVLELMQISLAEYWGKEGVGFESYFMKNNIFLLKDLRKVLLKDLRKEVKTEAIRFAIKWKNRMRSEPENSLEIMCFLQFIATYGLVSMLKGNEIVKLFGVICQHKQVRELCPTLGFADEIPGFVQNLIERKQLIVAVGYICSFKLIDSVPPYPLILLEGYVKDLRESHWALWREKEKVVNSQIADLRAVIQCVKDNKLESEFPSEHIEGEVVGLQKLKENWICSVPFVDSEAEQREQMKGKKRDRSTAFKMHMQPPRRSKRLETIK